MRRATGLFIMIGLILAAAPALAKGPMSATVTGPGIDEPVQLFDQWDHDPAQGEQIAKLMEQTGIWYATPALESIDPPVDLGSGYLLTWIPHQITQMLYLHADGGPVIHTPDQEALRGWGSGVTGWWKAPPELIETLRSLGVPVAAEDASSSLPEPAWLVVLALAAIIAAGARFVNSRLRPVVSSQ
jgi:hypothetical protein